LAILSQGGEFSHLVAPPGSTLKPLVLNSLIARGKLEPDEQYPCPRNLVLGSRNLSCIHPVIGRPLNVSEVISYSCNCAVAHFSERFAPGELAVSLRNQGISPLGDPSDVRLQALGEEGVTVTPVELARAYARLSRPEIVAGLEGAVQFGTAQAASLPHLQVAGKTGSVRTPSGLHAAWFAGFAPSHNPEIVLSVFTQGLSGGSDAAPKAAALLREHFGSRA
jgi:cell division protein FtsI/penicillin-binding protein 2